MTDTNPRFSEPSPPKVTPGTWHYKDRKKPSNGVRIHTGGQRIFVMNRDVLGLAEALADHIQYSKSKETQR